MDIIPGLGLQGGRWVAIASEPGSENKPYPDGPLVKAGELEKLGARWIYLFDVDGAKAGRPRQLGLVRSVISRVGCKFQLGGGYRTEVFVDEALRSGASRIVLGPRAISEPQWLDTVLASHGHEHILVSIDCVHGVVAIDGWESQTALTVTSIGQRLAKQGVERIIYTDLTADQRGAPDPEAVEDIATRTGLRLIVAGGIRRIEHLEGLIRRLGNRLDGVIVDRGFAEGTFPLEQAIATYQT